MAETEDVSKIRAALEILRVPNPSGTDKMSWMRGQFKRTYSGSERYCVLGALRHVGSNINLNTRNKDIATILKVINEQFPLKEFGWRSIPSFNDRKERTFEEIEQVMEKAAVLREEDGAASDWTLGK